MKDETNKTTGASEPEEQGPLTAAEKRESAQLQLEHQRLQTEDLRTRVERERILRAERTRLHEAHQQAIEANRIQREADQAICQHKKGGLDQEKFFDGDNHKYSVIKNIYPWGLRVCICSRCLKEVNEPSQQLKLSNPKEYESRMAEFKAWWAYPTDNIVSGSVIFAIVPNAVVRAPRKRALARA